MRNKIKIMLKIYELFFNLFISPIINFVGFLALCLIGLFCFLREEYTYSEFFWSRSAMDQLLDAFQVWYLTSDFPFEFVGILALCLILFFIFFESLLWAAKTFFDYGQKDS
tara:strand:+ start:73 stop:405 length:333 start_codon:yes stop_codon:yes gene_type:complete